MFEWCLGHVARCLGNWRCFGHGLVLARYIYFWSDVVSFCNSLCQLWDCISTCRFVFESCVQAARQQTTTQKIRQILVDALLLRLSAGLIVIMNVICILFGIRPVSHGPQFYKLSMGHFNGVPNLHVGRALYRIRCHEVHSKMHLYRIQEQQV